MLGAVALDHSSAIRGRVPARERRPDAAAVLLSTCPKYVELIRDGVEARGVLEPPLCAGCRLRRDLHDQPGKETGWVCEAERLVENAPRALWSQYGPASGFSRDALFRYLNGVYCGFAVELGPFLLFASGLALPALGVERLPQSFRYLPYSALVGISKSRKCRNCHDGFRNLTFAILRRWVGTSRQHPALKC